MQNPPLLTVQPVNSGLNQVKTTHSNPILTHIAPNRTKPAIKPKLNTDPELSTTNFLSLKKNEANKCDHNKK